MYVVSKETKRKQRVKQAGRYELKDSDGLRAKRSVFLFVSIRKQVERLLTSLFQFVLIAIAIFKELADK